MADAILAHPDALIDVQWQTDHLRTMGLVEAGVDVLMVDTAHGHAKLLLDMIRKLKADGRTVLLISHNMRDVVALADIVDPHGSTIASVTVNLAQGPLLVDAPLAPSPSVPPAWPYPRTFLARPALSPAFFQIPASV